MSSSDLGRVVEVQADACHEAGSPLYGRLLHAVADDVRAGGPSATVLGSDRHPDPTASALALRFLGAVHRLVLEGRAPKLAAHYPSVGGDPGEQASRALLDLVRRNKRSLIERLGDPVQTNEVGRSAVLVGGFAAVATARPLPMRVLEIGASAGLNLRFDRYWYDTGEGTFGDPGSPVRFAGMWESPPPALTASVQVVERRGCDPDPIDPTSTEGRLTLRSFVWPDQLERFSRLDAALQVAAQVPAEIDRADASTWLAERLDERELDLSTVVVHSIVLQYLGREGRHRLRATIEAAGCRARPRAPLAWLRMEPAGERAELRLTTWPGGEERLLAKAGYHGKPITWLGRS